VVVQRRLELKYASIHGVQFLAGHLFALTIKPMKKLLSILFLLVTLNLFGAASYYGKFYGDAYGLTNFNFVKTTNIVDIALPSAGVYITNSSGSNLAFYASCYTPSGSGGVAIRVYNAAGVSQFTNTVYADGVSGQHAILSAFIQPNWYYIITGAGTMVNCQRVYSPLGGAVYTVSSGSGGVSATEVTNIANAQIAASGAVTNGYFTNRTDVVATGGNIAIGTNNFGGGGASAAWSFLPSTNITVGAGTNIIVVDGAGTAAVNVNYYYYGKTTPPSWGTPIARAVWTNSNGFAVWSDSPPTTFFIGTNVYTQSFYSANCNSSALTNLAGLTWTKNGSQPAATNPVPSSVLYSSPTGSTNIVYSDTNSGVLFLGEGAFRNGVVTTNAAATAGQIPVATNGSYAWMTPAAAIATVVNGSANNTIQTNLIFYNTTNLNTTLTPYTATFAANELVMILGTTNKVPLASAGQDYGAPNFDGTLTTWGYNNSGDAMYNCGRFFGNSWTWQLASPGSDTRALILKGMAAQTAAGGGAFILETRAHSGSPGTHGTFNNPLYVATNGLMAIGNLTDSSDANNNALKPRAWLEVIGDGSKWSGGSSTIPSLALASKPLTATVVNGAFEYDGTNFWLAVTNKVDGSLVRRKVALIGESGAVTNNF
jgi:hypothetical protein